MWWLGLIACALPGRHRAACSTTTPGPHTRTTGNAHTQAGRELPYTLFLPIKIANNPRPLELACAGRGFTPRLEAAPGVADCGPALPAFAGQRPAEAELVISNPTDRTIEVVCPDLDVRHREEEEALRSLDM